MDVISGTKPRITVGGPLPVVETQAEPPQLTAMSNGAIIAEIRREDGFVNATKMCKAGNKRWNDYLELVSVKEYIELLISKICGLESQSTSDSVIKSKPGRYGGTWVHPLIAINLAQWISSEFAIEVASLVLRYNTGQVTTEESQTAARQLVSPGTTEATREITEEDSIELSMEREKTKQAEAHAKVRLAEIELETLRLNVHVRKYT